MRVRHFAAVLVGLAACGPSDEGNDAAIDLFPSNERAAAIDLTTSDLASSEHAPGTTRESFIWVWKDYQNSLNAVAAHATSFTAVSPALYDLNYAYTTGVPEFNNASHVDAFSGLTSAQVASRAHAAGLRCVPLIKAGATNSGTDQGIQNILNDSPTGTQSSFITALINEATTKGYDGYNLDWEVDPTKTTYALYGTKLQSFLSALTSALHAHGWSSSLDVAGYLVKQSNCSGGTGWVDLPNVAPLIDYVVYMNYSNTLGGPSSSCPASITLPQPCPNNFTGHLNLLCTQVPIANAMMALESDPPSTNPIAGAVFTELQSYGLRAVAVWPGSNTDGPGATYAFLDTASIQPPTTDWYTLLSNFLAAP